jgi:hypothetical protein
MLHNPIRRMGRENAMSRIDEKGKHRGFSGFFLGKK